MNRSMDKRKITQLNFDGTEQEELLAVKKTVTLEEFREHLNNANLTPTERKLLWQECYRRYKQREATRRWRKKNVRKKK